MNEYVPVSAVPDAFFKRPWYPSVVGMSALASGTVNGVIPANVGNGISNAPIIVEAGTTPNTPNIAISMAMRTFRHCVLRVGPSMVRRRTFIPYPNKRDSRHVNTSGLLDPHETDVHFLCLSGAQNKVRLFGAPALLNRFQDSDRTQ